MPTTLSTFAASEATMRYREPYVTDGLNKKAAVAAPAGIYRGFKLVGTGAGDRQMTVDPDSSSGDSVAVYRTTGGHALTVRKIGAIALSLTGYASQDVVIALYVTYSIGATTSAVIRAYTVAEYDAAVEKPELIVLGTVAVPAAATPISGTDHHDRRIGAWLNVAPERHRWNQILVNGSFEQSGAVAGAGQSQGWYFDFVTTSGPRFSAALTYPRTGIWSLLAEVIGAPATVTRNALQLLGTPVRMGQRVRVRFYYKILNTLTGGSATLLVRFLTTDTTGTTTGYTLLSLSSFPSVSSSWVEVDKTFEVAGAGGVSHMITALQVSLSSTLSTWSGTDVLAFDDFQMWVEPIDVLDPEAEFDQGGSPQLVGLQQWLGQNDTPLLPGAVQKFGATYSGSGSGLPSFTSRALLTTRLDQALNEIAQPFDLLYGGQELGRGWIDATAPLTAAEMPRQTFRTRSTDTATLLSYVPNAGSGALRVYASPLGLVRTVNARWDNTNGWWVSDTTGSAAYMETLGVDGLAVQIKYPTLPANWTSWDTISTLKGEDVGGSVFVTSLDFDTTAALPVTVPPNNGSVYKESRVCGWGVFDTAAGPAIGTWYDSFNINEGVTSFPTNNDCRISLRTSFLSTTDYVILGMAQWGTTGYFIQATKVAAGQFDLHIIDPLTGLQVAWNNANVIGLDIWFIVLGRQ